MDEQVPRKFHKGEFRLQLVEWVTRRHRPDKIVEDDELIQVFTYLNPKAKPPSRRTLRRDIDTVYNMTRDEVKKLFAAHTGRFNAIYDCWTAGNGHEFLATMVSFVHQGKLYVIALDLTEMTVAHTGANLARALHQVFEDFGIAERILAHTGDNATNNDSMLDNLEDHYGQDSLSGRQTQVCCFGHILNLVYMVCLFHQEKGSEPRRAWS